VSSYENPPFDPAESPERDRSGRSRLPGGISTQTAAAGLIIVVVLGLLWLLALPDKEQPAELGTATAVAGVAATQTAGPGAANLPGAAGTQVLGPSAATRTALAGTVFTVPTAAAPIVGAPTSVVIGTAVMTAPVSSGQLVAGTFVRVTGSGIEGIRFRFGPGLTYATIRIATDGEDMLVLDGPETADGYTWWRLQDAMGNIGWAADQYLQSIAAPANWSPPAASPTFEAGVVTPEAVPVAPITTP
jgi:hypothetical protein